MSFGLDIETLGGEWFDVVDGHTYNLSPMWRKALPQVIGDGSTSELDGWSVPALLPHLDRGVLDIVRNSDDYRQLDPPNGWGDFDGFREIFLRFAEVCHRHPNSSVRWNG